jgi:hypothetical protein
MRMAMLLLISVGPTGQAIVGTPLRGLFDGHLAGPPTPVKCVQSVAESVCGGVYRWNAQAAKQFTLWNEGAVLQQIRQFPGEFPQPPSQPRHEAAAAREIVPHIAIQVMARILRLQDRSEELSEYLRYHLEGVTEK